MKRVKTAIVMYLVLHRLADWRMPLVGITVTLVTAAGSPGLMSALRC